MDTSRFGTTVVAVVSVIAAITLSMKVGITISRWWHWLPPLVTALVAIWPITFVLLRIERRIYGYFAHLPTPKR